jgi:hypothetical protein
MHVWANRDAHMGPDDDYEVCNSTDERGCLDIAARPFFCEDS